jgi:hypothetical protein
LRKPAVDISTIGLLHFGEGLPVSVNECLFATVIAAYRLGFRKAERPGHFSD